MELPLSMEGSRVCRSCLRHKSDSTSGELCDLFTSYSHTGGGAPRSPLLCDMLASCSNTKVLSNDNLPKCICSECASTLAVAYNFKVTCENAYKWLLQNYPSRNVKEEPTMELKQLQNGLDMEHYCDSGNRDNYSMSHANENVDIKVEAAAIKSDEIENLMIDNLYDLGNYETVEQLKEIELKETKKNFLDASQDNRQRRKTKERIQKKFKLKSSQLPNALKCNQCPKVFKFPHMVRRHMEVHTTFKSYFCVICEKYYKSEVEHNKSHKNETKFVCDVCSKSFGTKSKIRIHLETHATGRRKNILCGVPGCDKAYLSVQGLNRHKLLHTGRKDFLCHLCSKTFADKAGLFYHMPFHFNERNYKCRTCGKPFLTSSNRNQHEQRHSEKRFCCAQCERRFHNRVSLRRHMLTHSKELQHPCAFCARRFARGDNRRRHELILHGCTSNTDNNVNCHRLTNQHPRQCDS